MPRIVRKKWNEDWRDEDELEEEEECECPWVDSKGKVRETAYCQYLLENLRGCKGKFGAVLSGNSRKELLGKIPVYAQSTKTEEFPK